MKKPSKRWKEFGQLVDIVDIRIGKQQRKLVKLKKRYQSLLMSIQEKWSSVEKEQHKLKTLRPVMEKESISHHFMRRECFKSRIESLFFDISTIKQEADGLEVEIEKTEGEKRRLEKRKDALSEIQDQLRLQ